MFVEEADIRFADVVEMAQTEAQEVVQCLAFEGPNPSLSEGIRIWSKERCSQTADALTLEEATERSRELGVAIVDKESRLEVLVFKPHHHIPPLLLDPPTVRVIRGRTEKHLTRADMNKRKAIRDPHTQQIDHVFGEEVARDDRVGMEPNELLPDSLTSCPSAQGRGCQSFIFQDSLD